MNAQVFEMSTNRSFLEVLQEVAAKGETELTFHTGVTMAVTGDTTIGEIQRRIYS